MSAPEPSIWMRAAAEAVGTFILIFFGCGAVHCAVLTGDLQGLWQVGVVWGIAIMLAIYTIGGVSGAHINPAITVGLAAWNLFPRQLVPVYVASQLVGAFLAAAALYVLFQPYLEAKERSLGVTRGQSMSIVTAMCYGEYFPNPGSLAASDGPLSASRMAEWSSRVSEPVAFFAEVLGTALLAFVVVAVTDAGNPNHPGRLAPVFIGLTVAALICVLAPLTQACFNPARDWGPRLFAYLAGWGEAAIPGPNGRGIVTVYIIAPVAGAILGTGAYQMLFRSRAAAPAGQDEGAD